MRAIAALRRACQAVTPEDKSTSVAKTLSRTLPIHNPDFNLRHIQPTGMLRRIVQFHASQQSGGRRHSQDFLETGSEMGVEVINNQMQLPGLSGHDPGLEPFLRCPPVQNNWMDHETERFILEERLR